MAWTAPMTAVAGNIWTSAEFNAHIRDNLLETMPGKATAANRMYISNGLNSIAERVPSTATVATAQTTSSTSYTNLTTVGPQVTVTTGTAALVWAVVRCQHSSGGAECSWAVEVSGATTLAANDNWRGLQSGVTAANPNRFGVMHLFSNLTAGSNTFTIKYKTSGATATFQDRDIIVVPL
jgi:hypothetical protein